MLIVVEGEKGAEHNQAGTRPSNDGMVMQPSGQMSGERMVGYKRRM